MEVNDWADILLFFGDGDVDVGQTRGILNDDEGAERQKREKKKGTLICCR